MRGSWRWDRIRVVGHTGGGRGHRFESGDNCHTLDWHRHINPVRGGDTGKPEMAKEDNVFVCHGTREGNSTAG